MMKLSPRLKKIAEQIKSEPETEQKATEVQPENIIMIMIQK